ncbi:hypothetical protein FJD36_17805 [Pseudomonas chlororaphis subsp. chlororaphis]|nr:hypothetical protein FJD36_17805 [Pseudomonas chlororaphis subsp. chlororaphis]
MALRARTASVFKRLPGNEHSGLERVGEVTDGSREVARSLLRKDFFDRYKKGHSFEWPFLLFGCGSRI